MKARRTFQIAAAMLTMIFAVVLLASAIMVILPIVGNKSLAPFQEWGENIRDNVVPKLSFLPQTGIWGGVTVVLVMLLLPSILFIFTTLLLFPRVKNGKNGSHSFGCFLGILGTLIFAIPAEVFASKIFGDKKYTYMIVFGMCAAFLLLFLILGMLKDKKKKAVKAAEPKEQTTTDTLVGETADEEIDTTVHTDTNDRIWVAEPESTPQEIEEVPEEQQTNKYVPDDTRSVSDVMNTTYGAPIEDVGTDNMKKIQTVRSLLDANAITKEEYIALVNAYLGVKDIK